MWTAPPYRAVSPHNLLPIKNGVTIAVTLFLLSITFYVRSRQEPSEGGKAITFSSRNFHFPLWYRHTIYHGGIKMKKIKLSAKHNVKNPSKKLGAYAAEREASEHFKQIKEMDCPSCFETMLLIDGVWQCQNCAYCISQVDMLNGATFWFCDGCSALLNVQPGFTTKSGKWLCVRCNWANDVTEDNIID